MFNTLKIKDYVDHVGLSPPSQHANLPILSLKEPLGISQNSNSLTALILKEIMDAKVV